MPEAVKLFITNGKFSEPFNVQRRIYRDYEDDITKYVEGLDSSKVKKVYRHISAQLAKDNHKFQISKIGHGARAREYSGTEEWLKDAGIINIAYNLEELELPFSNYEIYNGALYESLVSEALIKSGFKLYFYKNIDATIELDFLIRIKNEIVPIEVKRNRGRSRSLNAILANNKKIKFGLKLTNGNIGFENNKFTFPYYLTFLLKKFFKETEYIKWN